MALRKRNRAKKAAKKQRAPKKSVRSSRRPTKSPKKVKPASRVRSGSRGTQLVETPGRSRQRATRVVYQVWLTSRGNRPEEVKKAETGCGGDPTQSVPYMVAKFVDNQAGAQSCAKRLTDAGGSVEIRTK
jgi:hypothetical protein